MASTVHYTVGKPVRLDDQGEPTLFEVRKVVGIGTASGVIHARSLAYHLCWNERYCQYDITIAAGGNFGAEIGWIKECRDSNRKGNWVARQSYDLDEISRGELVWGDCLSQALNAFLR